MIVLSTACRRMSCCGRRRLLLDFQTRPFHSGFVSCLDDAVTVKASRPSVTITRKKFSELPKRRVVLGGHSLPPPSAKVPSQSDASVPNDLVIPSSYRLTTTEEPERGIRNTQGLDTPSQQSSAVVEEEQPRKRRGRPPKAANGVPTHDAGADIPATPDTPTKTRRRRKTKVDGAPAANAGADIPATTDTRTKPCRRRKTKVDGAPAANAGAEIPATTDTPTKTRRRRKTKAGDTVDTAAPPKQPRNMLATEILNNLAKFPHCILLTRVGQFYESYFDQAIEVARLLNIKLTSRVWDKQSIAMCGFPLMHLDKYLKVLVQQNKRFVAMCEEFPRYSASGQKPEFDRRVVRVITPGTLIDEPFINQYENNYLLSISADHGATEEMDGTSPVGLAWIDVSTGEFFAKTSSRDALKDDLARICPREVVLEERLQPIPSHPIEQLLADEGCFVSYATPSQETLVKHSPETAATPDDLNKLERDLSSVPSAYSPEETSAITILTNFLHANLLEHMPRLSMPSREGNAERMQIDSHTIKALEIRESTREGGTTGSLLSVVKRTVTRSGTRLLARWLCSPSTSVKEIQARQSLVAFFHARQHLLSDVRHFLDEVEDTTRIVQRFLLGRGDPGDLVSISKTINVWSAIRKRLDLEKQMESSERGFLLSEDWSSVDAIVCRMSDLQDLESRINLALQNIETADESRNGQDADSTLPADTEEPSKICSKFDIPSRCSIRPEFSSQLASLHTTLADILEQRRKLERQLQVDYEAPSLTLRTSPAQGMHVHIGRSRRDQAAVKASPLFINISESGSTSSYFYQPWSSLGNQLFETATAITNAEKEAFSLLRNEVKAFATHLRRNARIMDELDVTLGFASLAAELRFTRPVITDNTTYEVTNGRHPTVELGLLTSGRVFTPNSVALERASRLHIITGPNMAGKSTFLRQAALIAILAQTGSFVPADHAVIGVVDKLFSRVGAKDDLFRDRSTFMVEMLETAEILRRATPKSLVIMDEVGRGTTVKDGLAIAFAAVHYLVTQNQCRALFATHFHELADMLGYSDSHRGGGVFHEVGFFCTDVDETDDNHFAYSHRLRPGVNRDSHGLKVAQLAGMPESAVLLAKQVLNALKGQDHIGSQQLSSLGQSLTRSR